MYGLWLFIWIHNQGNTVKTCILDIDGTRMTWLYSGEIWNMMFHFINDALELISIYNKLWLQAFLLTTGAW